MVETGVDKLIIVLTIIEHVAILLSLRCLPYVLTITVVLAFI